MEIYMVCSLAEFLTRAASGAAGHWGNAAAAAAGRESMKQQFI